MTRYNILGILALLPMWTGVAFAQSDAPQWGVYVAKGAAPLKTQVTEALEKELADVGTVLPNRKVIKARREAGLNVPKAREIENQYALGAAAELSHLVIVDTEKEETITDSGKTRFEFFARVHVLDIAAKAGIFEEWYPIRGGVLVPENLASLVSEVKSALVKAKSGAEDAPVAAAAAAAAGEAGVAVAAADAAPSPEAGAETADATPAVEDEAPAASADEAAPPVEGEQPAAEVEPGSEEAVEAVAVADEEPAMGPGAEPTDDGTAVEEIQATEISDDAAQPAAESAATSDDGRLYQKMKRKQGLFGFSLKDTIGWAAVAGGGVMLVSGISVMATREDRTRSFELGGRTTDVTQENSRAGGAWLTTLGALAVGGGLALVFINPRGDDGGVAVSPVVTSDGAAFLLSGGF